MGFRLWLDADTAWAEGAHENRPMGAACVAVSAVFAHRDFRKTHRCPPRSDPCYRGLFASLGQVNAFLRACRSQPFRPQPIPFKTRLLP